MTHKAGEPAGWPKGPFPEKWGFQAVEKRLEGAWNAARERAWAELLASGATALDPLDDLYVRPFIGGDAAAIEALKSAGCVVFGHAASGARILEGARVVVPTTDVLDALVVIAVAGPHHGIGNRAIVRFLVQARAFATFEVQVVGEDLLVLVLSAKNEEGARLCADRLPHIAPTIDTAGLRERLLEGTPLRLDWSPPR